MNLADALAIVNRPAVTAPDLQLTYAGLEHHARHIAGSLRMQSYWITLQVLRSGDFGHPPAELRKAVEELGSAPDAPETLMTIHESLTGMRCALSRSKKLSRAQ